MAPKSAEIMKTTEIDDPLPKLVAPQASPRRYQLIYFNCLVHGYAHLAMVYGIYLAVTTATWKTLIFHYIVTVLAGMGVTAGAHRLWSHKAYKAKMPLQIILMIFNSLVFQNNVIHWVRDHRMHHRYSDTDGDPHNATRGFFFSHIGWLLVRKHPEMLRRGHTVDMSDLLANPVLRFQKKYAILVFGTFCFGLPTVIPMYFFGESLNTAWHLNMMRYVLNLHMTFLVNSAAHLWGNRPYDKYIKPVQNLSVSFLAFGEGFHNYHHAFPWDYRTAELGNKWLNFTTLFIDLCERIGWAYELKTVPVDVALSRAGRTGDGSNMWGFKQHDGG